MDKQGNIFVFGNTAGHLYSINTATSSAAIISTVSVSTSNVDGANCILSNASLPVTFGAVHSFIVNDRLQVSWSTLTETNNDHFEIEASGDGTTFRKIGEVKSQALNGNSDTELSYSFSGTAAAAAAVLGVSSFILGLSVINRRRQITGGLIMLSMLITFSIAACHKDRPPDIKEEGHLFIRIKQVDIDGGSAYSKVVQAVRE